MHFYVKNKPFGDEVKDFYYGEVLKDFNFLYFTHSDHHVTYKQILENDQQRNAFFDLAAAYAAQLQYRDMLNLKPFAEHALQFFKLYLQARGFELATPTEVKEDSSNFQNTFLLVTGCQTREVRNERVRGAYNALSYLDVPEVHVVMSGAHPGSEQRVSMRSEKHPIEPDEAGAMNVCFSDLLESDRNPPHPRLHFHKESSSTRTSENIKHFFEKFPFDHSTSNHILVSSSAFHLPRISKEIEIYLRDTPSQSIDRVTLIQSEHFSLKHSSDVLEHQIYVKQMTYELFSLFLNQEPKRLNEMFKRETSLRV